MVIDDCCLKRNYTNPQPMDNKALLRCKPCSFAVGISGGLPSNAHFNTPNDCGWACNKNHELLPSAGGLGLTCQHCEQPNCSVGEYWNVCDTCAPCVPAAANANFTGAGTIRYDNMSCPVKCNVGFYYDTTANVCILCTTSAALACDSQPGGPFYELQCGNRNDAECITCLVCPPGFNMSTPCTGFLDMTCAACDTSQLTMPGLYQQGGAEWRLGEGVFDYCRWECKEGTMYNAIDNTCVVCHGSPCGIGEFYDSCTQENNFTGCSPCTTPDNAIVISTGLPFQNNSCAWRCPDSMQYNTTTSLCENSVVVAIPSINIETNQDPCKYITFTTNGVLYHICGWGHFLEPNLVQEMKEQLQIKNITCRELCAECAELPERMMYLQQGSCESVCKTPLLWNGTYCVDIAEIQ
jgi:hypothetical protein